MAMALFEDKNEPVNIYRKGSATANAQEKMGQRLGAGLASPPPHNKEQVVDRIAAKRELAAQPPVQLPSQQFPAQDITEARHATPFVAGPGKAPAGMVENFKYGMNPPGGQTFEQVSAGSANLPPAELVGRSLGNAARAVRGAVGINPPVADTSQRFPSNLNAAVAAAPRHGGMSGGIARDFLTQATTPGQQLSVQQPPANTTPVAPVQTDPTAPAGYNLGKKVGGMFGGLKEGMDARVNRQIDLVTAAPRAAMQFGENVVRGMRGEAPNTKPFSMSPSAAQAAAPQPSANVAAFRQAEAQNPAPGRLGAMLSARDDRQADAMLYGDQAKIVGGNSPQAETAAMREVGRAPAPPPSVRPTADMAPGGWMRNEQTGEVLTIGANRGARMGMFDAQGNAVSDVSKVAGRVPVGPDGRPIRAGSGLNGRVPGGMTDSGLSVQFTKNVPDSVRREVMQPLGANDATAISRNSEARQQWFGRNGYEKVNPDTNMTASQEAALPAKERVALAGARLQAKTAADSNAVSRLQAEGNVEVNRGNLAVNQAEQATKAKGAGLDMTAKQMEIDSKKTTEALLAKYDDPETTPEEKARIEKALITRGVLKPPTKQLEVVKRKLPAKLGEDGGEQVGVANLVDGRIQWDGGGQLPPPPKNVNERVKGQQYDVPGIGVVVWNGTAWEGA